MADSISECSVNRERTFSTQLPQVMPVRETVWAFMV